MNINFDDDELTGAFDCCEHGSGPVGVTVVGLAYACEQGPAPKEGASSLLMGGQLWQCGKVLAAALAEGRVPAATRETLAGKRAIELGCGMAGLPGVALALLGCSEVTLTDTASVVPLLTANAHAASEAAVAAGRPVRLRAEELDWLDDAGLARRMGEDKYDVVVCADVAYSCDLHAALLRSVHAVLAPEGVAIFVESDRSDTVTHRFSGQKGLATFFEYCERFDTGDRDTIGHVCRRARSPKALLALAAESAALAGPRSRGKKQGGAKPSPGRAASAGGGSLEAPHVMQPPLPVGVAA